MFAHLPSTTIAKRLPVALGALLTAGTLTACSGQAATDAALGQSHNSAGTSQQIASTATSVDVPEVDYSAYDTDEWDEAEAQDIALNGNTNVEITSAGVYRLHGTLDAQVIVNAPEDAQVVLILDGATITSDATAIEVTQADDVAVHLAAGSTNTVTSSAAGSASASAEGETQNDGQQTPAAIRADCDLTISGEGQLKVTSEHNDAVVSTDDLVVRGGTLTVKAGDDALRGKDALVISGGTLQVTAGGDGLKANGDADKQTGSLLIEGGSTTIAAGDDGAHANNALVQTAGTVEVSRSTEAYEATTIALSDGTVTLTSSDDGLNATTGDGLEDATPGILIAGGTLTVNAEGDGLDSNGSLQITGGKVVVYGPTQPGNGALDADAAVSITGGEVWTTSSGGMELAPTGEGSQHFVQANVSGSAGSTISVRSGDVTLELQAAKDFSSMMLSSAQLSEGEATITVGAESTTATVDEATAGGMGGMGPGRGQGARFEGTPPEGMQGMPGQRPAQGSGSSNRS